MRPAAPRHEIAANEGTADYYETPDAGRACAVATHLPTADAAQRPLEGYDEIRRWHASLMELPGWRQPFPA